MDFQEFPKMGRLTRECVITEKIDGTNAQIHIVAAEEVMGVSAHQLRIADFGHLLVFAGSRNRYITPDADNFGFASWVRDHADELVALGPGRHYGEWWGGWHSAALWADREAIQPVQRGAVASSRRGALRDGEPRPARGTEGFD